MAIRLIKEVINNKGYVINSKDREIFQEGEDLQSFFGLSDSDAIEFILYDINDNQLPQRDGELVRYVVLSTENIKDYLMIADGTVFKSNVIPEYFIDIERLIREAGYDNGIFKAQITLINKRVGTEDESNRVWIKEISPSRTEVRLLPLNKKKTPEELKTRFDIFYRDGDFRDDVAPFIEQYLEKINPLTAISYINGRYSENNWLNKLKEEFKIQNFEKFISDVSVKFVEASKYEFSNRISDIANINYGKLKSTPIGLELSVKDVKAKCRAIILQCINFYLPLQNIQTTTTATIEKNASVDEVETYIRTNSSTNQFDSNSPTVETVTQKPVGTQTGTLSIGGKTTNQTNTTLPAFQTGGPSPIVNPPPPVVILGACVLSNGTCSQRSKEECSQLGGTYLGDGSNCPTVSTGGTGGGGTGGGGTVGGGRDDGNTSRVAILDSNVNLQVT
jgi:hypothetical protein